MMHVFPRLVDRESAQVIAEVGDARAANNFQTNRLKIMKGVDLNE
jgi:hypothetical protein